MSDATVTPLHPSPARGEGPSRNALRQRRHRAKKRKATVTRNAPVTPPIVKQAEGVTPVAQPLGDVGDVTAYVAAIGLWQADCALAAPPS